MCGIGIQGINQVLMFHNPLVSGDRINSFNHPGIRVAEKISDLRGGKIGLFQLSAESGPPVMVVVEFIDSQFLKGFPVGPAERGEMTRRFRVAAMDNKTA